MYSSKCTSSTRPSAVKLIPSQRDFEMGEFPFGGTRKMGTCRGLWAQNSRKLVTASWTWYCWVGAAVAGDCGSAGSDGCATVTPPG